jgi:hypothetical protein
MEWKSDPSELERERRMRRTRTKDTGRTGSSTVRDRDGLLPSIGHHIQYKSIVSDDFERGRSRRDDMTFDAKSIPSSSSPHILPSSYLRSDALCTSPYTLTTRIHARHGAHLSLQAPFASLMRGLHLPRRPTPLQPRPSRRVPRDLLPSCIPSTSPYHVSQRRKS